MGRRNSRTPHVNQKIAGFMTAGSDHLHYNLCVILQKGKVVPASNADIVLKTTKASDGTYTFRHAGQTHRIKTLKGKLGSGASASVRPGTFTDNGSTYDIAIKVSKSKSKSTITENVGELAMHLRVYCALNERTEADKAGVACVPRPFFIADLSGAGLAIGMSGMRTTLAQGIASRADGKEQIAFLRKTFRSVALALAHLQSEFQFMHGDLHNANVMNVETDTPCIIDFGMSSATDPDDAKKRRLTDTRYRTTGFVASLDLLTLITSTRDDLSKVKDYSSAMWCDRIVGDFWTSVQSDVQATSSSKRKNKYKVENVVREAQRSIREDGSLPSYTHHLLYQDAKGIRYPPTVPSKFEASLKKAGSSAPKVTADFRKHLVRVRRS